MDRLLILVFIMIAVIAFSIGLYCGSNYRDSGLIATTVSAQDSSLCELPGFRPWEVRE